ncbi:hypothetical protein RMN57_03155 [Kitasatospora sp. CM 4170]|uniref:Integral membrane protein n=1 Tax=Kitasatospora aburaviensis TaxID=67265 RepID=A0ABW1FB71_9ACTN|nr:hypothetical protein [Kitasatospora sp. CM 4170]WNM43771.1 hypothetical protein RMN57_03155 [Kitasatospora sp. CM 4170]
MSDPTSGSRAPAGPTGPSPVRTGAGEGPVGRPTAAAPPRWAAWAERAALCVVGDALVLASFGAGGEGGGGAARLGPIGLVAALALATWAAPPPPLPARRPSTWPARLAAQRNTVLATGSVVLAALGEPSLWQGAAVAVLLIGYLLLVDALGPDRRRPRPAHALAALAVSALVLPPAFASTGAAEWSRPVAVLGVVVAAVGVGLALGTRRHPDGDADAAGAGPRPGS